jgi:hypothetical protein
MLMWSVFPRLLLRRLRSVVRGGGDVCLVRLGLIRVLVSIDWCFLLEWESDMLEDEEERRSCMGNAWVGWMVAEPGHGACMSLRNVMIFVFFSCIVVGLVA